jgi:hypothetical protein
VSVRASSATADETATTADETAATADETAATADETATAAHEADRGVVQLYMAHGEDLFPSVGSKVWGDE